MSRSAGTGQPRFFRCAKCRLSRNQLGAASCSSVELTGRTREVKRLRQALGQRMTRVSREYRCTCGHVGWSRHFQLARQLDSN